MERNDCRCKVGEGLRSTHCPIHGTCNCCHGATCPNHDEPEEFVPMTTDQLLDLVRTLKMTPQEQEEQRRSFALGNASIDNPAITRELVDQAAEKLNAEETSAK
jgi:hypothetical protein